MYVCTYVHLSFLSYLDKNVGLYATLKRLLAVLVISRKIHLLITERKISFGGLKTFFDFLTHVRTYERLIRTVLYTEITKYS